MDEFLGVWHQSAQWTVKAKSFLEDKLTQEQQEDLKMEVDEGNKEVEEGEAATSPKKKVSDFIWSLERA